MKYTDLARNPRKVDDLHARCFVGASIERKSMATKFNQGKAYHGSSAVTDGKLQGATDTDYFYFFCPNCSGQKIMRILDYEVRQEQSDNPYDSQMESKAAKGFTLAFKVHCEKCKLTDFVKISNLGWQGGSFANKDPLR